MRGIPNIRMLSVRAALLAVLAAGLMLPGAQAQSAKQNQKSDKQASSSSQAQPPSAGSKAGEEESAPANKEHAGGPQEGIKIHGHWVIDVRNPDGKLVTHREFENAYDPGNFPANIFARQNSIGFWGIILIDYYNDNPTLLEPSDTGGAFGEGNVESHNLAISNGGGALMLSGSYIQTFSDSIGQVFTFNRFCAPGVPPSSPCQNGVGTMFTSTALTPSINVNAGQIVQVTVTITFS